MILRSMVEGAPLQASTLPSLDAQDWRELAISILEHRIAIALGSDLDRWGMPADLAAELGETGRKHRLRSDWLLLELRRVLERLEEAQIPAVVLKGAALAHALGYPRFFLDLDVLVPRSALDTASRALEPLGYAVGRTGRSDLYYERHHFHRVLRTESGITLELHWDLARPSDYFHLDPEGVRSRCRSLPFHGLAMRVPSHADQLLHAAQQCLREGFNDARRVLDAARLLHAGAADDPALAARAHASGLAPALWVLLIATEALTSVAAPHLVRSLHPGTVRGKSLQALDLPTVLLERRANRLRGLRGWLLLMCAPNASVAARTLLAVVFPGERGLLEDGHHPDTPPSLGRRALLSAKRIGQTAKLAAYQAWRFGPHLTTRGPRS